MAAGLIGLITVAPGLDRAIEPEASSEAGNGFAIERAPDGQFYTEATAGKARIRLMADPGAEQVLLSGDDARALGLEVKPGFTPVTLPTLAVGPHQLVKVEAVIAPDLPVSLLGQTFLSRLSQVEISGQRMILR